MIRDMDLIRCLLLHIEKKSDGKILLLGYNLKQFEPNILEFHCKLLFEVGLISEFESVDPNKEPYDFKIGSLTWKGYDFLEFIRDENIWNKIKEELTDREIPMNISSIESSYFRVVGIIK